MLVDITLILTSYNQGEEALRKSIVSVSIQKDCSYQLIVADDCSEVDPSNAVAEMCSELGIEDFQVVRAESNLKTVGNILNVKDAVKGRYVKAFGAGDRLYDEFTLRDIVAFCDEHDASVGFGGIVKDVDGCVFAAPRNSRSYPPFKEASRKRLFKSQVNWFDWIPGCCQFYRTDVLFDYLNRLHSDYGVLYCEDFAALLALDEHDVFFMDRNILLYEIGAGISTSGRSESVARMYRDHRAFYDGLAKMKPFGGSYFFARAFFGAREFIALKTPFYRFFQSLLMRSYSK